MIPIETGHTTKNYRVYEIGDYIYCYSYGVPVARYRDNAGKYIEFGNKWDYSSTTIRHVQWFLKEIRQWEADISLEKLREYVSHHGRYYLDVVDFSHDLDGYAQPFVDLPLKFDY